MATLNLIEKGNIEPVYMHELRDTNPQYVKNVY